MPSAALTMATSPARHAAVSPREAGSRHVAAASISKNTKAVAVVVSESSVVRILSRGEIVAEIIPELWLIQQMTDHSTNDDE